MLMPWLEAMWGSVLATWPLPPGCTTLPSHAPLPPRFKVEIVPEGEAGDIILDESVPIFAPQVGPCLAYQYMNETT